MGNSLEVNVFATVEPNDNDFKNKIPVSTINKILFEENCIEIKGEHFKEYIPLKNLTFIKCNNPITEFGYQSTECEMVVLIKATDDVRDDRMFDRLHQIRRELVKQGIFKKQE